MVDISSQNNRINITISSSGNTANTNVTPDYAQYYSEKSKEWAISNRIVDNIDYSSKYYANESKKQADISTAKTAEVIESGNTAVSNIESARDNAITDVNTAGATQVALATEQATIATNKASEVIASGNNALSNIDTAKSEALTEIETLHSSSVTDITGLKNTSIADITNLKNTSISDITTTKDNAITTITTQETTSKNNVIATGNAQVDRVVATGNNYDNLTHKNITNCLLEVPQRIKLELNDGTLTLKAGSQVIVPNGFEADGTTPKFDYVTVESDVTYTRSYNSQSLIYFNPSKNIIDGFALNMVTSGATPPSTITTTYWLWYDTVNNLVKKTDNNGSTWENAGSLPIGLITVLNGAISLIDQVFNGMGYIGSTVWVDKGVKGLIPNGRNEDGTLNNREFATDKVLTYTSDKYANSRYITLSATGVNIPYQSYYLYDSFNNINLVQGGKVVNAVVGSLNTDANGVISDFQPKQPFRAVDYNDKSEISGWGMPSSKHINLTLGASGSTYTAPANGYFCVSIKSTGTQKLTYVSIANNNTYVNIRDANYHSSTSAAYTATCVCPAKKGDIVTVAYDVAATIQSSRLLFVYAEGEV